MLRYSQKIDFVNPYDQGEAEDDRAKVKYVEIDIYGTSFIAMDHEAGGEFGFNEAFSFMVPCENQEEINCLWDKLSFVQEVEQCGILL